MPLDAQRLLSIDMLPRSVAYGDREAMLYALAVGLGRTGGDSDLRFVYEDGLAVVPSFATVLAFDDSWLADAGIDLAHVVHGALDIAFEQPFAPAGAVDVAFRIAGLSDKGAGKGGLVHQETILSQNGAAACTVLSSLFVRGGGGFGGSVGRDIPSERLPDRTADDSVVVETRLEQALLFRLLGDRNPLHADPAIARASSFDRPILHGACTFGIACATVLRRFCALDPARLGRFAARFAGPLYPGETLGFSFWIDGDRIGFRAVAVERGAIVLDNGLAIVREA
ncbi:3-alpha,7-alpha,12-alpha-trihydroxy-5-beta-cholest-24-enoyl-CoA hydratase [Phreatobacter aquaticus]|uniref:3-alpha,7-alpha, 12-alpha-trihydroxy-5-beta-cholest-24-enoyl-CoA hydratase n=1 Tax=Phreatobacter aquaticus TaxID=2570229 RepID=A0A4D7QG45_9HYPH|nr:MaoC family dehydratase [Phreatobacter aquaticus]QCK85935.1 3-alpha,7-alpha,12-alpha-trihydroxy-5-beta-cholest-24-enoyl-CoA hydratase [Phreatobacter aquaticus]